jgi:hypothetical protein
LARSDFHRLDSIERFHSLTEHPPFPDLSWRDECPTPPDGARANASYIAATLAESAVTQSFEIFNSRGERKIVTSADLARGTFNKEGGQAGLVKAIQEWAR